MSADGKTLRTCSKPTEARAAVPDVESEWVTKRRRSRSRWSNTREKGLQQGTKRPLSPECRKSPCTDSDGDMQTASGHSSKNEIRLLLNNVQWRTLQIELLMSADVSFYFDKTYEATVPSCYSLNLEDHVSPFILERAEILLARRQEKKKNSSRPGSSTGHRDNAATEEMGGRAASV